MVSGPLQPTALPTSLPLPPGGTGSAAHQHDWSATPLGPVEAWPSELRVAASMVLGSNIPMLLAWGPDLLVIHNDSYGEKVLGDRRPALGRPLAEVWRDEWAAIEGNVARVLAGETVFVESAPRRLKRGGTTETAWLTFCYNPVADGQGGVSGLFGVVTSISHDARSEDRLREGEERFRLIADSAPVPIWVTQLDRRRSFVNQAYVDFLLVSREEARQLDWRTILHPDDQDRILAESLAGEASLKPFVLEGRYRGGDGEWHWLRSISQPRWGPAGEHVGFIGVAHDVTEAKAAEARLIELTEELERRVENRTAELREALDRLRAEGIERERAEEALRQAQKMEAVGRLTGGIAHDFNNLLTPVIGGLERIVGALEDERLKRLAVNALESSRRGAKLTTQLLAFSRVQRLEVAPVDVHRIISGLRHILRHTIGPDVEIETRLHGDPVHALCDGNQLENAILNLAINARDAMPEGGKLTIGCALVDERDYHELAPGRYVRLQVADTGTGMSPDIIARATEPFFSTKAFGKGTGLGLAQVYGIAVQAGGNLRIDSREAEGTTISLYLPWVAHEESGSIGGAASSERSDAAAPGTTICIVDDDGDVRCFIAELLGDLGYRVSAHASAQSALDWLAGERPDLILLDFAMPELDGAQLARRIRQLHGDLPLAFITGFAETRQIEECAGGTVAVLRKPFGIDELASFVKQALRPVAVPA